MGPLLSIGMASYAGLGPTSDATAPVPPLVGRAEAFVDSAVFAQVVEYICVSHMLRVPRSLASQLAK